MNPLPSPRDRPISSSSSSSSSMDTTDDTFLERVKELRQSQFKLFDDIQHTGKKGQKDCHTKPSVFSLIHSLSFLQLYHENISLMNDTLSKERHLCVSDGRKILCLHLKPTKDRVQDCCYDLEPLPKISTLRFVDDGHPVSLCLFRLGSDACVVRGHKLPPSRMDPNISFKDEEDTFECSSSDEVYCLYVDNNGGLSVSVNHAILPLSKAKVWPVVAKLDSQTHVIESFNMTIPSSHEVLKLSYLHHDHVCAKLSHEPPHSDESFSRNVWFHLPIADHIYARGNTNHRFQIFDPKAGKWILHPYLRTSLPRLFSCSHVAELLLFGFGQCIGKFWVLESSDPLYLVIGVGDDGHMNYNAVAAFLVTESGHILCYQRLPHFFGGFMKIFRVSQGAIFCAADEGNTWCAVVPGTTVVSDQHLLLVSTFTVLTSLHAHLVIERIMTQKTYEEGLHRLPFEAEFDFLKIIVKDWHAFELAEGDISKYLPVCLSACFI